MPEVEGDILKSQWVAQLSFTRWLDVVQNG